ncbi:ArfGap-domain-containing protein [Aspergillus steynii IBT 23096]|uniref:ArfGap-domain-containing protein n=1 Tax=Aspergillus steynii IBT 23096 TaxID=1392250 RepID=A0A2I2FRG1_9EURO|nr:ArfGap-domain-containing protein [Aspergillus steynii IBT 23096]PLB43225.1 ArfGap-domain-containing protein [Aspergillus steynii IBT 23096]
MSKMWEVDPETKAKLLQYSKTNGNDRCCDCGAPSPQWASPKFGTFICLNCAGTHRGLGVHISFVRSISMDAFKNSETQRMEHGGNDTWKAFFDNHPVTLSEGRTFEDSTIKERYEGEVGEEYKERLAAKVEGREYDAAQVQRNISASRKSEQPSRSSTPLAAGVGSTGRGSGSPAEGGQLGRSGSARKERNEAYFAKMGAENATRDAKLPPSQGGKFTGFGGGLPVEDTPRGGGAGGNGRGVPGLDDFQKDPMAALTKGFGWFTTAVGKGAKTMNDSYIQPTAKSFAESDFAAQARVHASTFGQNLQTGARGAADQFNRFVEGPDDARRREREDPERKDFWDDFSSLGEENHRRNTSRSSAIGTAAMKPSTGTGGATGAGAGAGAGTTAPAAGRKSQDEDWGENW